MKLIDKLLITTAKEEGHFIFASGNHATEKLEFDNIARNKFLLAYVARKLAKLISQANPDIDVIVTVASGANILAEPISKQLSKILNKKVGYILTAKDSNKEFFIPKIDREITGIKCVIVDDIFNHGTNTKKVKGLLSEYRFEVLGVAVIFNRNYSSKTTLDKGIKVASLVDYPLRDWPAKDCKYC